MAAIYLKRTESLISVYEAGRHDFRHADAPWVGRATASATCRRGALVPRGDARKTRPARRARLLGFRADGATAVGGGRPQLRVRRRHRADDIDTLLGIANCWLDSDPAAAESGCVARWRRVLDRALSTANLGWRWRCRTTTPTPWWNSSGAWRWRDRMLPTAGHSSISRFTSATRDAPTTSLRVFESGCPATRTWRRIWPTRTRCCARDG